MFALVDCDNFYVSCERVFNPKLKGRPVVILSNNDGCAISRSNEAKALGIKMAAPVFFMKEIIKKNGIVCLSSNYTLYGDMSQRVMNIYEQFSPQIEVYSIDESFLFFGGVQKSKLLDIALEIQQTVQQWTGIPVCVGMGATKTLAKAANKLAKKLLSGVLILDQNQNISASLEKLPVEDVWGVGGQYTKWLKENGVHTAKDLRDAEDKWIRQKMTVVGQRTVWELRGTSCIPMELVAPDKKAICHARSFGRLLDKKEEMQEALSLYASQAAFKLRRAGLVGRTLCVFLETNPFRSHDPQYRNSYTLDLPTPTNLTPEIVHYALEALGKIFRTGYKYKKVGIMLLELVPEATVQMGLFDTVDRNRSQKLMTALDAVNTKFGKFSLNFAGGAINEDWQPKFKFRSPRYTTQWEELPIALAR